MEGKEIEFSEGFTDLHTTSYKEIIEGRGFGLTDAAPSIQVAHDIRHSTVLGKTGEFHPYLNSI
jgi:UDP-N-acetyl-2-amino-2-deoxyglucuronate dehydrogenase